MAAQVGRDDVVVIAQCGGDPIPIATMVAPTVQQDQWRRRGVSPVDVVQAQSLREIHAGRGAGCVQETPPVTNVVHGIVPCCVEFINGGDLSRGGTRDRGGFVGVAVGRLRLADGDRHHSADTGRAGPARQRPNFHGRLSVGKSGAAAGLSPGPSGPGRNVRRRQAIRIVRLWRAEGYARRGRTVRGWAASIATSGDAITGVSGGSFPAAYYGLYRDKAFETFEQDFLYRDTESYIWGIYLLPWNWTWISDPLVGTNDFMERVYDRTMFHGATFADLQRLGRPLIAIGATDLAYGNPVLFTQETFDLICANLDKFPIARAVAASNGFPGLFSPITLTSRVEDCHGRKPGWLNDISDAELNDPLSRVGVQAKLVEQYLDPDRTRYVHLVDGGVSDNLALRAGAGVLQKRGPGAR
jgi:hypothetical protein